MPLGKQRNFHFFFLRSFLFRIKFWIAWFLSRGSNEELAMMLQNAAVFFLLLSLSLFLLLPIALFASPKTSWVFSQLSSLLVAQRNASWKERNALYTLIHLKRDWSCNYSKCIMNYVIVIASLERWNQARTLKTNCFSCVSSFKCTTAFIIRNICHFTSLFKH